MVGFALSYGTMAEQTMTKAYTKPRKSALRMITRRDKARCGSLCGNAKDVCLAEAKGKEDTAEADLEARYKPSKENRYKAGSPRRKLNTRWPRKNVTIRRVMRKKFA